METPTLLRGLRRNHYVEIACDVPWRFLTRSPKGITSRSPESKYQTMPLTEIQSLSVAEYAAKDARLWFWVTGPFLAAGAHVPIMRAWGFEPTAVAIVWIKPLASKFDQGQLFLDDTLFKMGNGYTTRQNAEYVVLGRRGNPPERNSKSIRQVIFEPAREHSRKPDRFYSAVERYGDGPYLELFSRQKRQGWTCRGNEVEKFT